ncbi:MAG: class I SAM-dependent methyltransferase [Gammaproteobacteria bacterium]|nr:class I SAM-dependent methyltransferase [Gammaproteobacteria bacterium]
MSREKHWNKVYTDKLPLEVSWFQNEPSMSLQLINASGVNKNSAIIDVGGGASRLVDHLLEAGYDNLAVLDISASAIEHAQSRLGHQQEQVEWFVSDVTGFESPRKFELWHDRAVFHFLTEAADRAKYLTSLNHGLRTNGHLIIATFAIGGPEKCSGLDIVQYDESRMSNELGPDYELQDVHHEIHITPDNKEQKFIYFHYKKIN